MLSKDEIEQPVGEMIGVPASLMQEMLARLDRLEGRERDHNETVEYLEGQVSASVPAAEAQGLEAARVWMTDFIVAVRGFISADLATGENKAEMRERVIRQLAQLPAFWA